MPTEERPLPTDNEKWRLMADGIVALRPPLTGDNLRAAIIGLVSAAADEARAEEREECCRDMCPDCNRREPLDPYMRHLFEGTPANRCRAERIRSRGGEPREGWTK